MPRVLRQRRRRIRVKALGVQQRLYQPLLMQVDDAPGDAPQRKACHHALLLHPVFQKTGARRRGRARPGLDRKARPEIPGVLDHVRRRPRYQQFTRVAGHARRPHADFRRVAHFLHRHHEIHLVLHDARRHVRERHQTFRQQHHLFRVVRIHHRVTQRPAARFPRRPVGVAEFVAARHTEKRHVYRQLAALQQVHPPPVRVDLHRLVHQPVRNRVRQLAAHPRRVDAGYHPVADMLYQRRVAGHQRTRRQRQVFEPQPRQRLHHMVDHLVPFTERVVERYRHPVLQPALADGLFQVGAQLATVFFGDVIQPRRALVGAHERLQMTFFRVLLLQCFNNITHVPVLSWRRPGVRSRRRPARKTCFTLRRPTGVRPTPARAPPPDGRGRLSGCRSFFRSAKSPPARRARPLPPP